jgi:hypothetical protein
MTKAPDFLIGTPEDGFRGVPMRSADDLGSETAFQIDA